MAMLFSLISAMLHPYSVNDIAPKGCFTPMPVRIRVSA